jgi:hypothetical protein
MPELKMPEKPPSRNDVLRRPTLLSFTDRTYVVKIDRQVCPVKRPYLPADLIPLCGDITIERIPKEVPLPIWKNVKL